ncbi:MAG: Vanillate O-demethylase oxidoreductase, partial [Caulobacteraceae bacterium]|nr:Vanillate O-demethylase oxidoreductase [Caulobacteraceae bacterium]
MTLLVAARIHEATDIVSFELVDPEGRELPPFSAGSHIDVEVAPGLVRQYSLCNPPAERRRYQIGVLREPRSRGGSEALHERLQPGDRIRVGEPRNHFPLASDASRHLLFAGGIGVTPILCMAERLAHTGAPFALHYAARSRDRAAFTDRVGACGGALYFDDEPQSGRLDLQALLRRPEPDAHVYVCGPAGFIAAVLDTAARAGWSEAQLHREFFAPAEPADDAASDSFEIQIASSGQVLTVPAGRPVIDVLAEHGVDIPVSCEQGVCGTCVTRVLEGVPDHRDMFMTGAEH